MRNGLLSRGSQVQILPGAPDFKGDTPLHSSAVPPVPRETVGSPVGSRPWEPEPAPQWPAFIPIAIAILALAAFMQATLFAWVARVLEHAEHAMAGPWG